MSSTMLPPLKHAWKGCICQGTASEIAALNQALEYPGAE